MLPAIFDGRPPDWKPFSSVEQSKKNKHRVNLDPAFPLLAECYILFIDHHLTPHTHDYLEIAYVCAGKGHCEVRDRRIPMRTGDLVLVGDTDFHTFWSDYRDPLRIAVVYFLPELISRGGYDFLNYNYIAPFREAGHPPLISADRVDPELPRRIEHLYWMTHAEAFEPLAAKTELYEILLAASSLSLGAASSFSRGTAQRMTRELLSARRSEVHDNARINAVIAFLHQRIDGEISLSACASVAGLSRYGFCRFFRAATGDTLVEYVNKMRVDRARELLAVTALPISHIALDVGYETISYFNRVFRSLVGMTPSEFRRRAKELTESVGMNRSPSGEAE